MRGKRREAQPSGIKTFGSTFKNPDDERAERPHRRAAARGGRLPRPRRSAAPGSRTSTRTSSRTRRRDDRRHRGADGGGPPPRPRALRRRPRARGAGAGRGRVARRTGSFAEAGAAPRCRRTPAVGRRPQRRVGQAPTVAPGTVARASAAERRPRRCAQALVGRRQAGRRRAVVGAIAAAALGSPRATLVLVPRLVAGWPSIRDVRRESGSRAHDRDRVDRHALTAAAAEMTTLNVDEDELRGGGGAVPDGRVGQRRRRASHTADRRGHRAPAGAVAVAAMREVARRRRRHRPRPGSRPEAGCCPTIAVDDLPPSGRPRGRPARAGAGARARRPSRCAADRARRHSERHGVVDRAARAGSRSLRRAAPAAGGEVDRGGGACSPIPS